MNTRTTTQNRPNEGDFFILKSSSLTLLDGTIFTGQSPDWQTGNFTGEVVFNTGMTGYVESLTDPSYAGQILVFTFPLIGNYGVSAPKTWESERIHAAGVIVSEACRDWNHAQSDQSLLKWLHAQGVPILSDVDTRALTKHLRSHGTMNGIISDTKVSTSSLRKFKIPMVTIKEPIIYGAHHKKTVILVDCGMKANILRSLLSLGLQVKRVPSNYDYSGEDYDGVLISNGPGDPIDYKDTIVITRKALTKGKPVFGICLGSQILGLAAGARSYKLVYGHRGHNQPCMDNETGRCYITSQNHGYALDEKSIPKGWRVTFRNLNDDSIEGIEHQTKPFFAVQFHPEAHPGPTDTAWLFEKFYEYL